MCHLNWDNFNDPKHNITKMFKVLFSIFLYLERCGGT
jgi:hypothetical protein